MIALVTGGAGFIGRWLVRRLIDEGHSVIALDDLSNGRIENIEAFRDSSRFQFIQGDIRDPKTVIDLFKQPLDLVYHLAAEINVQKSIDDPQQTIDRDIIGTFQILQQCKEQVIPFLFMSTCMVYEQSMDEGGITETHPTKPASPYAAAKLSGEALTLSYHHSYGLPTMVVRPFNTYGPFQKTNGEGGVVAVFIKRAMKNQPLQIYGDGTQTRDLLYVEDCVDFLYKASQSKEAWGKILNAGTSQDIPIRRLAEMIAPNSEMIVHVPHIHPQAEILKLKCNPVLAQSLLDWSPRVSLEEGIQQTHTWIQGHLDL
jgi:dTDP-glucose 4,6-dehydratase